MESSFRPVHYLDSTRVAPLCRRSEGDMWNWTLAPQAVTCYRCRAELRSLEVRERVDRCA